MTDTYVVSVLRGDELVVQGGSSGGDLIWGDITDKPESFPPAPHTHAINDVSGLVGALASPVAGSVMFAAYGDARPSADPAVKVFWTKPPSGYPVAAFSGDYVIGSSSSTTAVFTEGFTGSNGSAWNSTNWAAGRTSTGSSATVQGNRGRLNPGTNTGANGNQSMKRNGSDLADGEWSGTFNFAFADDSDALELWIRADTITPGSGVYLRINRDGAVTIDDAVSSSYTTRATISFTTAAATDYKVRFRAVGTDLFAKIWSAAGTEPTGWMATATTAYVTAGLSLVAVRGGFSLGGRYVDLDDWTWSTISTGSTALDIVP